MKAKIVASAFTVASLIGLYLYGCATKPFILSPDATLNQTMGAIVLVILAAIGTTMLTIVIVRWLWKE